MNVKYDDDKMNPFTSDRSESECFARLEIPAYTGPPQRSIYLAQGEKLHGSPNIIRHSRHIHITHKWNHSFICMQSIAHDGSVDYSVFVVLCPSNV